MKVDNPNAFRFIMQDEIYLLDNDKAVKQTPPVNTTPADAPVIAPPPVQTPVISFNYLGQNSKHFLILVNYANEEFIAEAHLAALQNILKRKDLEIADVAIVNTHTYPGIGIKELNEYFTPEKLLILGEKALPGGLEKPALNQAITTGGCPILYSFSFDEMMASNDHKKAFWDQMKTL